jgi:hypothetical protein
MIEPLYTLKQLSAKTGVNVEFLRGLANDGQIEVVRKGPRGHFHIRESAWLAWVANHIEPPTSKVATMPLAPPNRAPVRPAPFDVDSLLPEGFVKPFPRSA